MKFYSNYFFIRSNSDHYRADIDGLRAIAVCLVIGFHSFPSKIPGGFIGVDIFFVISGYLVTKILIQAKSENRFDITDFFMRRIRRIFPALITVLIFLYSVGYFYFTSTEFKQLGEHIAGSTAFLSNFLLSAETGYFDTAVERKPLLHLWSLGVEEQFYIFLPLLLWICFRFHSRILIWLLSALLISFFVNLYTVTYSPSSAFFLPQSRFWELLIGSTLAALEQSKPHWKKNLPALTQAFPTPTLALFSSSIGLGLITLSALRLNSDLSLPGAWMLLPCIGVALCIATSAQAQPIRRLLSTSPMVWLGQISYPLYLWHWSLLSIATIFQDTRPSITDRFVLILVSIALAQATHSFIESPFRYGAFARRKVLVLGCTLLLIGTLGGYTYLNDGLPNRIFAKRFAHISEAILDWNPAEGLITRQYAGRQVLATSYDPPEILFFGDSHVEQFGPALSQLATEGKLPPTIILSAGGCPPIPSVFEDSMSYCASTINSLKHVLKNSDTIKTVVLGACWNCYFINEARSDTTTKNKFNYYFKDDTRHEFFRRGEGVTLALDALDGLIKEMAERYEVVLLLDNPMGETYNPSRMINSRLNIPIDALLSPTARLDSEQKSLNVRLSTLAQKHRIKAINQIDYLCKNDECPRLSTGQRPVYKDDHHFRPFYVVSIRELFSLLSTEK